MVPSSYFLQLSLIKRKRVIPTRNNIQVSQILWPQGLPTRPLWQALEKTFGDAQLCLYKWIQIGLHQIAESLQKHWCLSKSSFFLSTESHGPPVGVWASFIF